MRKFATNDLKQFYPCPFYVSWKGDLAHFSQPNGLTGFDETIFNFYLLESKLRFLSALNCSLANRQRNTEFDYNKSGAECFYFSQEKAESVLMKLSTVVL